MPLILIFKFLYHKYGQIYHECVQKKAKKNHLYDKKTYPSNPIPGPIENLVVSEHMVFFENQHKICFWDVERNQTSDIDMSEFDRVSGTISGMIKKIFFSKDKDFFVILFKDNHIEIVNTKKMKSRPFKTALINLTDIAQPSPKGFTFVVKQKDNKFNNYLCDIHLPEELEKNQKALDRFLEGPFPFAIYSFDFAPKRKYVALVGAEYTYFYLATKNTTTEIVVEGYLRSFVQKMPSKDIVAYIMNYRGLIPIASIPIKNKSIEKDCFSLDGTDLYRHLSMTSFSSDGKKIAIGQKDEVAVYDTTDIKAPKLLCSYAHNFTAFTKLVWKDYDSVLYATGRRKGENYHVTVLFFLPCLRKTVVKRSLHQLCKRIYNPKKKPKYVPMQDGFLSLFDFSNENKGAFFTKENLHQGHLYYGRIRKFSEEELKRELQLISAKWAFITIVISILFFENRLYYGIF